MIRERPFDGDEDQAYDDHQQRLLDAELEGRDAGRLGLAADLCPYFPIGRINKSLYDAWHRGRLRAVLNAIKGRSNAKT
jgi:hypothetical protein